MGTYLLQRNDFCAEFEGKARRLFEILAQYFPGRSNGSHEIR
jgi:hypothetical protein